MYLSFTRAFNWTPEQIDGLEIEMVFSYIAAQSKAQEEQPQYIDEVL